jgi:hypothetical protein
MTDITAASQDECQDIRTWPLDRQLEFYREMFFDSRIALWSFYQLPLEQQQHIISRCHLLMAQLGYIDRELEILLSAAAGDQEGATEKRETLE